MLLVKTQTERMVCGNIPGRNASSTPKHNKKSVTWTRLRASSRKLKSPNKKKGVGVWRASDILQEDFTVRNHTDV